MALVSVVCYDRPAMIEPLILYNKACLLERVYRLFAYLCGYSHFNHLASKNHSKLALLASIAIYYRVRFKEWPPLVLGPVTTFLLRLLQFDLMSCLL